MKTFFRGAQNRVDNFSRVAAQNVFFRPRRFPIGWPYPPFTQSPIARIRPTKVMPGVFSRDPPSNDQLPTTRLSFDWISSDFITFATFSVAAYNSVLQSHACTFEESCVGVLRGAPNKHAGQPMSDHLARVTAALGAREVEGKGPRMIPISACISLWSAWDTQIMRCLHAFLQLARSGGCKLAYC